MPDALMYWMMKNMQTPPMISTQHRTVMIILTPRLLLLRGSNGSGGGCDI